MVTSRIAFSTVVALMAVCGMASGAAVSVSATAPTVDGSDIAQLVGASDIGGDEGHIWSNRPAQGQTITTGGNVGGYLLKAVTLNNLSNTATSGNFTVRVNSFYTELYTHRQESTGTASYVPGDFITATFASPVYLAPNATYGFDWVSNGNGFVTANNTDTASYAGGTAYSSGGGGAGSNSMTARGADRVFHADMSTRTVGTDAKGSIGFNFVGGQGGGTMASADVAGAPGRAQANWNNLATDWYAGNVPAIVYDSLGQAVGAGNDSSLGIRVEYDSNTVWGTGIGSATPNERLMRGYLDDAGVGSAQPYINLYNIPYAKYNLILYVDGDQTNGVDGQYWLETLTGQVITPKIFTGDVGHFAGLFTQVPLSSTSQSGAAVGNFIVFEGLDSTGLRIRSSQVSGTRAPINAFQLEAVEVPEPATMVLLSFAAASIGGYIRRRK